MAGVRGTDPLTMMGPGYSLNDIMARMQSPQQPSAFRRILGGVAAGVANAFIPGVGSAIGRVITGGGTRGGMGGVGGVGGMGGVGGLGGSGSLASLGLDPSSSGIGALGSDSTQYLMLQQQITAESRAYEAVSSVMKAKHDASMAAIHNMH